MNKKSYMNLIICALFILVVITGVSATKLTVPPSLVQTKMYFSGEPKLGSPSELIVEISSSTQDVDKSIVSVILPDGVKLVDGNLNWNGSIKKGEVVKNYVNVLIEKEGEFIIRYASSDQEYGSSSGMLYLSISELGYETRNEIPVNMWTNLKPAAYRNGGLGYETYDEKINANVTLKFSDLPRV